jgi:hypothetical protein
MTNTAVFFHFSVLSHVMKIVVSSHPSVPYRNFDRSLRSRDPSWGVRDLEAVCEAAEAQGMELVDKIEMPANNLSLLFRRKKTMAK